MQKVSLAELQTQSQFRYEVNRHVNTITIIGKEWRVPLGFRSNADLEKAYALLQSLVASAAKSSHAAPQFSKASLAAEAGFKYLVVSPRCEDVAECVRLLSLQDPSPRLLCWLTKNSPHDMDFLLQESLNRLPLFIFNLEVLDRCSFYTESIPGTTAYFPCSVGTSMMQSVFSYDNVKLATFFQRSPYVGIHLESVPDLSSPLAIICRPRDEHKIRKIAKSLKFHVKELDSYAHPGLGWFEGAPQGTASSWFTGIGENSDDILRYFILHTKLTLPLLSYTLYYEFPGLQRLLRSKSLYYKDMSLEETICLTSQALARNTGKRSTFAERVLRIALCTHELGSPFGSEKELAYNSWPIALSVAEKMGCTEKEKTAVQFLIDGRRTISPHNGEKNKKADPLFLALGDEMRSAYEIGISLREWLDIKECFYFCVASCGNPPKICQEMLLTIKKIRQKYKLLLPYGICRGLTYCHGPLLKRSIYSSYLWEGRDPHHRDGISLKRRREKFEHLIVEKGKAALKGHFWEWLEKEIREDPLYGNAYLRHSEREQYRAFCTEGVLASPLIPTSKEDIEVIFILDDWGRLYIGIKHDSENPHEHGFSHASFLGGCPVAAAGKILLRDGKPVEINNHSGHYRCGVHEMKVAIEGLKKMGVCMDGVEVTMFVGGERRHFKTARECLDQFTSQSNVAG
jgi:hypothetical protein